MEARIPLFGTEAEALPAAAAGRKKDFRVCVIGGGGTGLALAYDLAQRGFGVTLLEKGELTSGTTGRHHGQLHCGARYAWSDRNIARECYSESLVLARIADPSIEYNGGFFIALTEEERALERTFIDACVESGIPAAAVEPERLERMEPRLVRGIKSAVSVPDGSFDAFRLAMMFAAGAKRMGAEILPWHEVRGFDFFGGRLRAVQALDLRSGPGRDIRIECDFAVSATGAWAGTVGRLAGVSIDITPASGSMLAVEGRLVDHVISRLRPPDDGDILVPQRGLAIIGTTQKLADSPEGILPGRDEIQFLLKAGAEMVPGFDTLPMRAAWAAARPLAGAGEAGDSEGRALSRDFRILDHEAEDGLAGFLTIIGGKATVLRAMAEKTADLICEKSGVAAESRTGRYRLPSWREYWRGATR